MKTRNLVLGFSAILLAIGSAFSTSSATALINEVIKITTSSVQNPDICIDQTVCVPVFAVCEGSGFPCQARVNSTGLSGGTALANVRENGSCIIINHGSAAPVTIVNNNCITGVQ